MCIQYFKQNINFLSLFHLYSFLCNPAKDVDLRKWAAEGLAYLTLDADVKEDLVEDTDSLKSIVDLSKVLISYLCTHNYYLSSSLLCLWVNVNRS